MAYDGKEVGATGIAGALAAVYPTSEAQGTKQDPVNELMRAHAKLAEAEKTFATIVEAVGHIDFRHGGIHCLCPFCVQVRTTLGAISAAAARTLEQIR